MPDVMGSQPHRTGINSEIVHHNLDSPPGTIVLGSEVNAVNPPWSSFEPYMMIPNMCIHGFLYNREKSPPLWGSGARLTPVILSPPPRGCFRCQAEKLLNTCHSLASWTVVKNFPCLCNYFLWASRGLLHSWPVFRAGSSGFQNERGTSPATGDCFLYTPGSRKELFSKGERTGIGQLGGNDCLI